MNGAVPMLAIDGPSGAGKGTVAGLLARRLGWNLLDSGALYRLLAFAAVNHGVDLTNEEALKVLAAHLDVQFVAADGSHGQRIILEGEEVTDVIRTEQVGAGASQVAALPAVRDALLQRQRAFLEAPGLVADGRDMGTVVFPDAPLKIFLTASRRSVRVDAPAVEGEGRGCRPVCLAGRNPRARRARQPARGRAAETGR